MNENTTQLLICPKCNRLYPLIRNIYQSKNYKVMLHIKCNKCLDQIYDYDQYISMIQNISPLPPYPSCCLNSSNEFFQCTYYCSSCSVFCCKQCSNNHMTHLLQSIPSFIQLTQKCSTIKRKIFFQFLLQKQVSQQNFESQIAMIDDLISEFQAMKEKLKSFYDNESQCIYQYNKILNLIYDSFEATQSVFNYNVYEMINKLDVSKQHSSISESINAFLLKVKETMNNYNINIEKSFVEAIGKMRPMHYYIKEPLIKTITTNNKTIIYSVIQLSNGYIVSANGNHVSFWDENTFKLLKALKPNSSKITSLYEIMSTNKLAACTLYVSIIIIDTRTYQTISILTFHSNIVWDFKKLSNGSFASCSGDHSIVIIDYKYNGVILKMKGHNESIRRIIESKDGCIISCSWDKSIRKWNLNSGECILTLKENSYSYPFDIIELDNDFLLSCGSDGQLKKWDIRQEKIIESMQVHNSKIWKMCLLNDGNIASCSRDYTIAIVNVNEMVVLFEYKLNSNKRFKCIIQLRNGRLVTGDKEGLIKFWKY